MSYLLIKAKTGEYNKWKSFYDKHLEMRKASGSKGSRIFRNASDPNETMILFEWNNTESARKFTQSDDLRLKMQESGVTGKPDFFFLDEIEKTSA